MQHDYYQILAISPTAGLDAMKKAYGRKAMQCHPDRGGSHAEMVLINEAWLILSDSELRSRYDAARTQPGDTAAQQAASADAEAARRRAEQYSRPCPSSSPTSLQSQQAKSVLQELQELPVGAVIGVVALLLFVAGFLIYLIADLGALWDGGKSKDFWHNLRVGVGVIVLAAVGIAIWGNFSKKR